jgi:Ti-type conjugative transfer relaxase TraA
MRLIWARISGAHDRLLNELEQETATCDARDRDERQTLIDRHLNERRAFEHSHQSHNLSVELESAFAKALRPDPRQHLVSPQEDLPFTLAQLRRNPALILTYLSDKQARFTETDIKRALASFIDDPLMLRNAIDTALASEELVPLTSSGTPDYTARDYQRAEAALFQTATTMAAHRTSTVRSSVLADRIAFQNARMQRQFGGQLSEEQENALRYICGGSQLSCVVGLAGAGKSTMLEVANAAWNQQGIKVRGAALSGKAADGLHESSGIESRTLASLELSWKNGYEPISRGDVLVVDEAGMIGTRQLSRITNKLNQIGAKLVLIGDPDQLQPIEAGQPFRHLIEYVGAARLTEIHRQKEDWQKLASRDLAAGRLQDALNAYDHHGAVHRANDQKQVLTALIENYMSDIETYGTDRTRLAFAHRRKDVFALNQAIRSALKHSDQIGEQETRLETETGPRAFASRERIVFTANDKELGVRNGMLGTIESVTEQQITVRLDGHEQTRIIFDPCRYRSFDHGYAVTVHKSQGATVDQAYVLASRTLDASLTYVAMTRHREQLSFFCK